MRLRPRKPVAPVTNTRIDSCLHGEIEEDAGFDQVPVVPEYFLFEIPSQDVIRVRWRDLIFQHDRYVHSWRNETSSQWVLLHQAFDAVRTNSEVIEKRVS